MATRSDRPEPDPNRPPGSATPGTPPDTSPGTAGTAQRASVNTVSVPPPQVRGGRVRYAGGGSQPVIVLTVRRRGRRRGGRKRYSRNTRDAQRVTYGAARAFYRLA